MIVLAACHVEVEKHRVANQSNQAVDVVWLHDGVELVLAVGMPPGGERPLTNFNAAECSTGVLVARTAAGREIARRTEPLCPDDTWVINGQGSSPPSPGS